MKTYTSLFTAQKVKFPIQDFISICDQNRSFLRIWSNFLTKSIMENLCAVLASQITQFAHIFCAVLATQIAHAMQRI